MSVAEKIAPASEPLLTWDELCAQHPGEWLCLRDVERDASGSIAGGRVVAHDRSMRRMLGAVGAPDGVVVAHTWNRPLQTPRLEMTDEIRDIVRVLR